MTMTREALADLQYHWGEAYLITGAADHWLAQRRDNGRTLSASTPKDLRDLMLADYSGQPVPRDLPAQDQP